MNLYNNNYFQSDEFRYLNENIFNSKIIEIGEKNFFLLRNTFKLKNKILTKFNFGTEFRGILEFIGQPVNINYENYDQKLKNFLNITQEIIKVYNPGIIIFRTLDIEEKNKYHSVNNIFENFGYRCRPWNTNIIDLHDVNKRYKEFKYNTRREIKIIKELEPQVEKLDSFDQYKVFLDYFFSSDGHSDYPNKKKYYKIETWKNLKKNHVFFLLKINEKVYATFAIRIFKSRAYWCMVSRVKKCKYSLHAYAINFLFNFLEKQNVQYLDLAGFNPYPKNTKEKGIKFFKEKFKGNIIYQPTFILDNTSIVKKIRFASNFFKRHKTFPDEPLI